MSLRLSLATAMMLAVTGIATAQTPPPAASPPAAPAAATPPTGSANLRPIPPGPGKRAAELQGLDKVTARSQRFFAPVGEATRFGTLSITVGDCLVNVPEAPPESVAYLPDPPALLQQVTEAGFEEVSRRLLSGGITQLITARRKFT